MKLFRQAGSLTRYMCRCVSSASTTTSTNTTTAATKRQNEIFNEEKARQLALVKRVEKIEVNYVDPNNPCKLLMNKYLSTPYHVAMHFTQSVVQKSAIALVNDRPWHMLQPLMEDCELKFVTMKDDNVTHANQAFWRACSHLMGAVLHSAFKDSIPLELARVPDIPISAGCFAYDVNLPFNWEPTRVELICLNRQAYSLAETRLNFERLEVSRTIAENIFQDQVYKKHNIDQSTSDRVVLFRLGDFIDLSPGPMVTSTGLMEPHRFTVTCVHSFNDYLRPGNKLLRFQGVALPSEFRVHHTHWTTIEDRAKTHVVEDLAPSLQSSPEEVSSQLEAASLCTEGEKQLLETRLL